MTAVPLRRAMLNTTQAYRVRFRGTNTRVLSPVRDPSEAMTEPRLRRGPSPVADLHCPHCGAGLPPLRAHEALRCPTCRLIVGAGRGITSEQAIPLSAGTSAGIRANAARRVDAEGIDESTVIGAIARVSVQLGGSCERLRMLDYDALAARDPELPELSAILATFGSWKAARAAAARSLRQADVLGVEAGEAVAEVERAAEAG